MLDIPQNESYNNSTIVARSKKMKSAIEEIHKGTFGNHDEIMSQACAKAVKVAVEKEDALLQLIQNDPEVLNAFKEYFEANSKSESAEVLDFYKAAFRDGFLLAFDILAGDEKT